MCIHSPRVWLFSALAFCSLASVSWGSHLRDLAIRQDLRGQVCVALADGRITPQERTEILADARLILKPEEYKSFKRALDRIAPPPQKNKSLSAKHPKGVKKSPVQAQSQKQRPTQPQMEIPAEPGLSPVIPIGAILPDAVVPRSPAR